MAPQQADPVKLRELILHIAKRMEKDQHAGQGRIKLAKLLWLSDFEAYRRFGRSITGARYVADELGPYSFREERLFMRDRERLGEEGISDLEFDSHLDAIKEMILWYPSEEPWSQPVPTENPGTRVAVSDAAPAEPNALLVLFRVE